MPPPCPRGALPGASLLLLLFLLLPLLCAAPDASRGNKLKLMLQKREAPAAAKAEVSVKETAAKAFLSSLRRQRRQLWDRSQPDVQQWYQQFLYLGFDEQKFEDDISYWTSLGRARNEYYGGYYQHHYDEDSPIGPRNPHTFRHGAGVIWNFHCWVESWMARPDLAAGYDGWQVLDPTPQEKSEGVYCCGPAPVKAIKEGDMLLKYDIPFIFAEVNADVVYWVVQGDGMQKQSIRSSDVGKFISTKSIGRDSREDITHNYKYPEGSEEERAVFEKAELQKKSIGEEDEGLHLRIKVSEGANKGSDFDVFAVVNNNTDEERVCRVTLCARAASHNGTLGPQCGLTDPEDIDIEPRAEKRVPLRILYEEYRDKLTQDNLIKVVALLKDHQTGDIIVSVRDIYVENPPIKIRILGEPMQNRKLVAEISLVNPLAVPLNGCVFVVEGTGLTEGQLVKELEEPVEPQAEAKFRMDLMPRLSGLQKLMVDFESDQLTGVKGYRNVIIAPQPM